MVILCKRLLQIFLVLLLSRTKAAMIDCSTAIIHFQLQRTCALTNARPLRLVESKRVVRRLGPIKATMNLWMNTMKSILIFFNHLRDVADGDCVAGLLEHSPPASGIVCLMAPKNLLQSWVNSLLLFMRRSCSMASNALPAFACGCAKLQNLPLTMFHECLKAVSNCSCTPGYLRYDR